MSVVFQMKRGTSDQWSTANPILADSELGIETDTKKIKRGDGTTPWNDLEYWYIPSNAYFLKDIPISDSTPGHQDVVTYNQINNEFEFVPVGQISVDPIERPVNLSPSDGSTAVTMPVVLTGSKYYSLYGKEQINMHIQVATDIDFTNIVFDEHVGTVQSYAVNSLNTTTQYYWRFRYQDEETTYSDFSEPTSFTTSDIYIETPTNMHPVDGATGIGESAYLQASPFNAVGQTDNHESTNWQIATDSLFNNIVWEDLDNIYNKEIIYLPRGVLQSNTQYYWRVQYKGENIGLSSYSSPTSFTTSDVGEIYGIKWDYVNDILTPITLTNSNLIENDYTNYPIHDRIKGCIMSYKNVRSKITFGKRKSDDTYIFDESGCEYGMIPTSVTYDSDNDFDNKAIIGQSSPSYLKYELNQPSVYTLSFWFKAYDDSIEQVLLDLNNPYRIMIALNHTGTGTVDFYDGSSWFPLTSITTNTPYNLIITYDNSAPDFNIYLNKSNIYNQTTALASATGSNILGIKASDLSSNQFIGEIALVYAFDKIIDSSEMDDLYNKIDFENSVNYYLRNDNFARREAPIHTGVCDGTESSHLVDSTTPFATNNIARVGDWVYNITKDEIARVEAVTDGNLLLDADIFESGDEWEMGSNTEGLDGEFMIEVPKFYVLATTETANNWHIILISQYPFNYNGIDAQRQIAFGDEAHNVIHDKVYVSAVRASTDNTSLFSRTNATPMTSFNTPQLRSRAKSTGKNFFGMHFAIWQMLQILSLTADKTWNAFEVYPYDESNGTDKTGCKEFMKLGIGKGLVNTPNGNKLACMFGFEALFGNKWLVPDGTLERLRYHNSAYYKNLCICLNHRYFTYATSGSPPTNYFWIENDPSVAQGWHYIKNIRCTSIYNIFAVSEVDNGADDLTYLKTSYYAVNGNNSSSASQSYWYTTLRGLSNMFKFHESGLKDQSMWPSSSSAYIVRLAAYND